MLRGYHVRMSRQSRHDLPRVSLVPAVKDQSASAITLQIKQYCVFPGKYIRTVDHTHTVNNQSCGDLCEVTIHRVKRSRELCFVYWLVELVALPGDLNTIDH